MISFLRARRAARRRDGDRGTTVTEVMIASALLVGVMATVFSVLASLHNVDRRAHALVSNEQAVRFVVTEMIRDVRSANPLLSFSSNAALYVNRIDLMSGPTAGPQTLVRWQYDPTGRTISRLEFQSDGTPISEIVKLRRVKNVDRGLDFLEYTSESGTDLVASGNGFNVGNCAIHVEVTVTSDANPGPQPFTLKSDTEIRNRLPGGIGCG